MSNLREARHQEQKLEAYYLARSGLEVGLSGIFQDYLKNGKPTNLFKEFKLNTSTVKKDSLSEDNSKGLLKEGEHIWLKYERATDDENMMIDPSGSKKFLKLISRGICYGDKTVNIGGKMGKNASFKDLILLINIKDGEERVFVDPDPDITLKVEGDNQYKGDIRDKWPKEWVIKWN